MGLMICCVDMSKIMGLWGGLLCNASYIRRLLRRSWCGHRRIPESDMKSAVRSGAASHCVFTNPGADALENTGMNKGRR